MHTANLLRTASVSPTDSRRRVAAGRRWLRAYINGCGNKVWRASLHASLTGKTFVEAAEWAYRSAGFVLIGQCRFLAAADFALCSLLSWAGDTSISSGYCVVLYPCSDCVCIL